MPLFRTVTCTRRHRWAKLLQNENRIGIHGIRTRWGGYGVEEAAEAQPKPFGGHAHPVAGIVQILNPEPRTGHVGRGGRSCAWTRQLPDQRKSRPSFQSSVGVGVDPAVRARGGPTKKLNP